MTSPTGRIPAAFQPVMIVTDDFMAARIVAKFRQEFPKLITYWEGNAEGLTAISSGPPLVVPIRHREPELPPDEVPRVVAKARAIAIFGPKRGRWK